ncbi:TIGR03618 family F420-dependent PPOX class oxidoreductase [Streptomyces hainanensis]|uniref:TIGR03618 family F420-dependent PPOX class oxidoreductase n=1 Tax=Streptomyces hainanensis TaxID=402648 RepID=A0A4R4SRD6_9ACTN|nr:TIGR03618 family F420-dependent PPOX class oxidoreductase [Streptomyces hainanensis]TDC66530.1 TIGR03618 family F420-dependent PPOX class oxidoreductase [Streptomyces hainanensis]
MSANKAAPRVLSEDEASRLLGDSGFGVLASVRASGHPHLTTVLYHWDEKERLVRVSSTAERGKPRQYRRDPHAALHVSTPDQLAFAVAQGTAEVSEPTAEPGDAVGRELLTVVPKALWLADEESFLRELVAERRVVIRIRVDRLYGTALDA